MASAMTDFVETQSGLASRYTEYMASGKKRYEIEHIWAANKKTVVMITNDVDEGILLADRIVPLSAGPGATFGPAVTVDIERPRDRKALNHDPRFKNLRGDVIDYLLGPGARKKGAARARSAGEVAAALEVGT